MNLPGSPVRFSNLGRRVHRSNSQSVNLARRVPQLVPQRGGAVRPKRTLHIEVGAVAIGQLHLPVDELGNTSVYAAWPRYFGRGGTPPR
jgi:hypothetical protein